MILQHLMYSRSRTKDYRWMMIAPELTDQGSLAIFEQLYSQWREVLATRPIDTTFPLVAGLKLPEKPVYCLVTFVETAYKDIHARPVQSLHGVCINIADAPDAHCILPWFLSDPDHFDPWPQVNYGGADALSGDVRELRVDLEQYSSKGNTQSLGISNQKRFIPYTDSGRNSLLATLENYSTFNINFVFGGSPIMDVEEQVFDFNIFAPLFYYQKSSCRISIKEQKTWRSSFLVKNYILSVIKNKKGSDEVIDEEKFSIRSSNIKDTDVGLDMIESYNQAKTAYNNLISRLRKTGWYVSKTGYELQKIGR